MITITILYLDPLGRLSTLILPQGSLLMLASLLSIIKNGVKDDSGKVEKASFTKALSKMSGYEVNEKTFKSYYEFYKDKTDKTIAWVKEWFKHD